MFVARSSSVARENSVGLIEMTENTLTQFLFFQLLPVNKQSGSILLFLRYEELPRKKKNGIVNKTRDSAVKIRL